PTITKLGKLRLLSLQNNGCFTADDNTAAFLEAHLSGWDHGCVTIHTTSLPDATYETSYHFVSLTADKGYWPYTWEMLDGPEWLTVFDDGVIHGWVEGEPGDYSVTVKVTDSEGNSAEKTFTLKVKPKP